MKSNSHGSALVNSVVFASLVEDSNFKLGTTIIEAKSSLGIGERYYQSLRNTYRKLAVIYPRNGKKTLTQCALKGLNDTLVPEGFVPLVLAFGEHLAIYTPSERKYPRPTANERSEIANNARIEITKHIAKFQVSRALRNQTPTALGSTFNLGSQFLVWRESVANNRILEWLGPNVVYSFYVNRRLSHLHCGKNDEVNQFSLSLILRYYNPEFTMFPFLSNFNDRLSYFRNLDVDCYATEVINEAGPLTQEPETKEAIDEEVKQNHNARICSP